MNPAIYRQYDDRWGKLPYPGSGAYLSDSGCGCLAVYHCAIELEEYASKLTVPKCRDYMVQYATVSDGTLWSGITEGLKHYGFKVHWKESDSMDDIFRELKDSCKCGVILFAKKKGPSYGPDGTLWTTIGHYIAFSDYKIENGQHWFYMKDSGPRKHDKWFSYEKSMRGCCRNVWICKSTSKKRYNPSDPSPKPAPTPTPTPWPTKYPGNYPVVKKYLEPGDKGENVIRLQQYLDWYYKGAFFKECGGADGIYGGNTLRWVKKMQTKFFGAKEADGLVGPKTIARMKKEGGYVEPTPAPKKYTEVIDVSDAQDDINWKKVKAAGIDGVMVRCGYRGYEAGVLKEDHMFMKHIKGASKAGLKLGIYFFTQALNAKEGKEEADYAISLLNKAGVSLYYPIAVDTEYINAPAGDHPRANNISKSALTQALKGFCDQIKARGYRPMLYANLNDLTNKIDVSKLDCDIWCAQYYTKCQYKGKYVMWQYTSDGRVNGVNGRVDRDQCYISTAAPKPMPTPAVPVEPKPAQTSNAKSTYPGKFPEVRVNRTAAEVIASTIKWAKWIAANNDFHYGYGEHAHHNGCYFCNTNQAKKGHMNKWEHTYCCNPFVHAAWSHGGLVPSMLKMCDNGKSYGFKSGEGYDASKLFKKVSKDNLKVGDVLCSNGHVALYIGNGKVVQTPHEDDNVPGSSKWNSSISIGTWGGYSRVYRFIGSVDADIIMRKGEVSDRVADLQRYLVWYGALPKGEEADGIYGEKTFKAVVKMQTDFFGAKEADGTIGPKTIAKMKAVKK